MDRWAESSTILSRNLISAEIGDSEIVYDLLRSDRMFSFVAKFWVNTWEFGVRLFLFLVYVFG